MKSAGPARAAPAMPPIALYKDTYSIETRGHSRHALRAYGKPYGVNCRTRYPLAKGIREYFAYDVVGAVHVGIEALAVRRPVETALEATAAESGRLLLVLRIVDGQRVRVEEARLAGVALLSALHLDAHQRCLVGQHRDEAGVGNTDEVLIVQIAHARFLFPERFLADDECADALGYQQINDAPAGCVQVVVDLPGAMGGEPLQLRRGAWMSQPLLQRGFALVIELVDRLH